MDGTGHHHAGIRGYLFSFQATDALALYAGATFTRWSRLEGIEVENSGVNAMFQSSFGTITEELEWEDTWSFAVGSAYQLNPKWVIRAGYAFDESPTNDHTVPCGFRERPRYLHPGCRLERL